MVAVDPRLQHEEAARRFPFDRIPHADHRAFRDIGMAGEHLFHAAGREPVARAVDDIVGAPEDEDIAIRVDRSRIRRVVIARERHEVALAHAPIVVPKRGQAARRHRQFDHQRAHGAVGRRVAGFIEHLQGVARHRHGRRARLDRQHPEPHRISGDGPARLRLPPMVDHRQAIDVACPIDGIGVRTFAGKKQSAKGGGIVLLEMDAGRIVLLDRPQRRRRGKQRDHLMVRTDAPKGAGVGRADWFALIHDGRRANQQRRIDDVGMADDPTDVGGGPEHLARRNIVKPVHRPGQRHEIAAGIADDAFGHAGRAGRVENVEGIGRLHFDAAGDAAVAPRFVCGRDPIVVASGKQGGLELRPLQHQQRIRLARG